MIGATSIRSDPASAKGSPAGQQGRQCDVRSCDSIRESCERKLEGSRGGAPTSNRRRRRRPRYTTIGDSTQGRTTPSKLVLPLGWLSPRTLVHAVLRLRPLLPGLSMYTTLRDLAIDTTSVHNIKVKHGLAAAGSFGPSCHSASRRWTATSDCGRSLTGTSTSSTVPSWSSRASTQEEQGSTGPGAHAAEARHYRVIPTEAAMLAFATASRFNVAGSLDGAFG